MSPGLRKLALTLHLVVSVGWMGAVGAFLALDLVALRGADSAHALDLGMVLITRWVIVPLSVASLLTGILQSLSTPWGLLRHHWVVAKLFITLVSAALLQVHLGPISALGAGGGLSLDRLQGLRGQVAVDAALALVALLVATLLSVYKPRGRTGFGERRREAPRARGAPFDAEQEAIGWDGRRPLMTRRS
jgi:hypothetical protein